MVSAARIYGRSLLASQLPVRAGEESNTRSALIVARNAAHSPMHIDEVCIEQHDAI
jgi:hypothetical protein